ncbi:MAG: AIR synthase-related protein [Bacteroidota bacterium]|nr:AIR synthase-related protein [Bacteroidota bacterium]
MKYDKRGVSASKKDVHAAIKNLDKGLFKNSFCKILPDHLSGNPENSLLMHADTAGTKTSLAYLYWKETADLNVWKGIVQDAIVMNIDDLACTGVVDNIIISSTIGRNKNLITADVIKTLIEGNQNFCNLMKKNGVNVFLSGGETADVGDIVRTVDVGITAFAQIKKNEIINIDIKAGNVIVGLESTGQSIYENSENSGIGSNGLTFARHEVLDKSYSKKYPESFDPNIPKEYVYSGNMKLTDKSDVENKNIGELLLSPTRTYLPVISKIIKKHKENISGIIHCTGGGQTKVLNFVENIHVIKDNLFKTPIVFRHIQEQNNCDWKELYQVFNMGHRLELYVDKSVADDIIKISEKFGIAARIIGYCEKFDDKKLTIKSEHGDFTY